MAVISARFFSAVAANEAVEVAVRLLNDTLVVLEPPPVAKVARLTCDSTRLRSALCAD
jgi:hypothetical protein